jgi:hypothetical protein
MRKKQKDSPEQPSNPVEQTEPRQDTQSPFQDNPQKEKGVEEKPTGAKKGIRFDQPNNSPGEVLKRLSHFIAYGLGDFLYRTKLPIPLATVKTHTRGGNAASGDYRVHHVRTRLKGEKLAGPEIRMTASEISDQMAANAAARLLQKAMSSTMSLRGEDLIQSIPDMLEDGIRYAVSLSPSLRQEDSNSKPTQNDAIRVAEVFSTALRLALSTAEVAGKLVSANRKDFDRDYERMLISVFSTVGVEFTPESAKEDAVYKYLEDSLAAKAKEAAIHRLTIDPFTNAEKEETFTTMVAKRIITDMNVWLCIRYKIATKQGATLEQLRTTQSAAEIYAANVLEAAASAGRDFTQKRDEAFKDIRRALKANAEAGSKRINANEINFFRTYIKAVKRHAEGTRRQVTIESAFANIEGTNKQSPFAAFVRSCDAILLESPESSVAQVPLGELMVDLNDEFPYTRPTNVIGYTGFSMPLYATSSVKTSNIRRFGHGRYTNDITKSGLLHWLYLQIQELGGVELEWENSSEDVAKELEIIAAKYLKDNHLDLRIFRRGVNHKPEVHPGELGACELLFFDIFTMELVRRCIRGEEGSGWTGRLSSGYTDDHHRRQDELVLRYPYEVRLFSRVMDAYTSAFKTMIGLIDHTSEFCDDPLNYGERDYLSLFHASLNARITDIRLSGTSITGGQMFLEEAVFTQNFVSVSKVLSADQAVTDVDGLSIIQLEKPGFFTIGVTECITSNFSEMPISHLNYEQRDVYRLGEANVRYGYMEKFDDAFLHHILSLKSASETYDQVRSFLAKPYRDKVFSGSDISRELKYGSCKDSRYYSAMFARFIETFYEAKSLADGLNIGRVRMSLAGLIDMGIISPLQSEKYEEQLLNYHHKVYAQVKGGVSIVRLPCFVDDDADGFKDSCSLTAKDLMPAVSLFYEAFRLAPTDLTAAARLFTPEYIIEITGSQDKSEGERLFVEKLKEDPTLLNPLISRYCTLIYPTSWATITRYAEQSRDFYARPEEVGNYFGPKIQVNPFSYNNINSNASNGQ